MAIDSRTIKFLQHPDVQKLLASGTFSKFYDYALKEQVVVGDLTDILLQAGINPLDYLQVVPTRYLVYSKAISGVKIPDHITAIEDSSFRSSHIIGVDIPVSITHIGFAAFWDCDKLTYIGYGGTKKQWHKLVPDRATCFDMDRNIIVTCSDGQIVMRDDGSLDE